MSGNDIIEGISAGYTQVLELAFTDSTKLRIQANFGSCQSDHVLCAVRGRACRTPHKSIATSQPISRAHAHSSWPGTK